MLSSPSPPSSPTVVAVGMGDARAASAGPLTDSAPAVSLVVMTLLPAFASAETRSIWPLPVVPPRHCEVDRNLRDAVPVRS